MADDQRYQEVVAAVERAGRSFLEDMQRVRGSTHDFAVSDFAFDVRQRSGTRHDFVHTGHHLLPQSF